jgi:hypothetical protein
VEITGHFSKPRAARRQGGRILSGPLLRSARPFGDPPEEEHQLLEIPVLVDDRDGDGLFDPEDRVLFIAIGLTRWIPQDKTLVRITHRYATHRVYWLTWGGAPGCEWREGGLSSGPLWEGDNPWIATFEEDLLWFPPTASTRMGLEESGGRGLGDGALSLPGLEPGTGSDFTVRLSRARQPSAP